MKALLSIKPEYADQILSGEKRFEFRRTMFRSIDVSVVIVYATLPVGKVIGEFRIGEVLFGDPESLWKKTRQYAGIEKGDYDKYFSGKSLGYAIEVNKPRRYKKPKQISDILPNGVAPQSFCYVA
jgi:predicted transcriptional regulator